MDLRLGQHVRSADDDIGILNDVVIETRTRAVTHLVVEPHRHHEQARLVPIDAVATIGERIDIALDLDQIRHLPQVTFFDYVQFDEPIAVDDGWVVGSEHVIATPGSNLDTPAMFAQDRIGVTYDRIPAGCCEIHVHSQVCSSDDHIVGHAAGLTVHCGHLVALTVHHGLPGFAHTTTLEAGLLRRLRTDRIDLRIDRVSFKALPSTSEAHRGRR